MQCHAQSTHACAHMQAIGGNDNRGGGGGGGRGEKWALVSKTDAVLIASLNHHRQPLDKVGQ